MTGDEHMASDRKVPEWVDRLGLARHPEGGWFAETWRSEIVLPRSVLPKAYSGERAAGTAIHFVLMPGEESAWHTVVGAELWFHHRGSPVVLDIAGDGDEPGVVETTILGSDIIAGQAPQALVAPGHWQRARPRDDEPALVSCVVVPGFDFADFRLERDPDTP